MGTATKTAWSVLRDEWAQRHGLQEPEATSAAGDEYPQPIRYVFVPQSEQEPHASVPVQVEGVVMSEATRLPLERRHEAIKYGDENCVMVAYPINYDELYNLKGRLLTLVDATFTDPQQRKAQKDLVWLTLRDWMEDVSSGAAAQPPVHLTDAELASNP